jgi:hypothetical protein
VTLRHQQSTGSPLLATMAQPLAPPHSGQRDAPADVADAASRPGVDIEFKMVDLSRDHRPLSRWPGITRGGSPP